MRYQISSTAGSALTLWGSRVALSALFVLTLSAPLKANTPGADGWELLSSDHGIQTFSRDVQDSRYKATRHVTELNASLPQVLAALGDGTTCVPWLKLCKSIKIIERVNQREFLAYVVLNMPWPVSNRDLVFRSIRIGEPEDEVVEVRQLAEPDAYPPGKLVRMISENVYNMELLPDRKVRLTWTLHTNPGGGLSAKLVNSRAHKETRRDLRSLIKYLAGH